MRLIGITGGVGAGKSELLGWIEAHYACVVLRADELAARLRAPGGACYEKLIALLGREALLPDGQIDRQEMARRLFADETLRASVNAIVHPAVKEAVLAAIEAAKEAGRADYFFLEAALLIEEGYGAILDELWYVKADREVRRKRLKESRGYSDEKIDRMLAAQLSEETFAAHCDFVIDNSGEREKAWEQIKKKLGETRW